MLGISTWLLVGGQANFARIDRSNYSCKTHLTINKTQRYSFLSTSATLSSLHEGWLCFSVAYGFPKVHFFHAAYEWSIMVIWSCVSIKHLRERKMMDACACVLPVLRSGVKTETFSPQNNCATELTLYSY